MSKSAKPSAVASVEETFRDFWENRPVRPRRGRKLGGVSAAIGLRYGIDPVLVRIAFVVGTLYGGAGLVLYLLGWLFLPSGADGASGASRRATSGAAAVLLVVLLIPALSWTLHLSGLIGLAFGATAVYLLHRNYGHRATEPAKPPETRDVSPTDEHTWVYPGDSSTKDVKPPSWDPLGAAPFAWDLPDPRETEPGRAPRRRWITPATLTVSAVAGILGGVWTSSPHTGFALALGVLGIGMVFGSFLRGGRALVAIAIPLAVLTLVTHGGVNYGTEGNVTVRETSAQAVLPRYGTGVGNVELNLDGLRLDNTQVVRTGAQVGVGNVIVRIPSTVDVTARCAAGMGTVTCLQRQQDGVNVHDEVVDNGPDGPGGGRLVLDLRAGTGKVEVIRD